MDNSAAYLELRGKYQPQAQQHRPKSSQSVHGYHTSKSSKHQSGEFDTLTYDESMSDMSSGAAIPGNHSSNSLRSIKKKPAKTPDSSGRIVNGDTNYKPGNMSNSSLDLKSDGSASNGGRVKSKSNWAKFKSRLVDLSLVNHRF